MGTGTASTRASPHSFRRSKSKSSASFFARFIYNELRYDSTIREESQPVSTDRISEYLSQFSQTRTLMLDQLRRMIVGQSDVIEQILAAIFTRGHCLLVGVPGLAKTLMVSSISQILDVSFKRIQFTPDLMPSDITGTMVLDENE